MTNIITNDVRFPSLAALKAAHSILLQRRRATDEYPEMLAEISSFIARGQASGVVLDDDDAREVAQSLLTYWANLLYRLGHEPPDSTLAEFDPLLAPTLPDEMCPYLGLDAFQEIDHNKFFGRRELVAKLVERLADHRLLAVVGPSGSGKSSLVRAGLLPALKAGALPGSQGWRYLPPIVPGSDPLAALNRVLPDKETGRLGDKETGRQGDKETAFDPLLVSVSPCLLVVDQFEEVFTLCDDVRVREAFIARLLELAEAHGEQHRVIMTMRSDFETFVARVPSLQPLFEQGRIQVTPLSAAELREAIEQPAEPVGLKFEAGLVEALLQDILGEPAGLPLLQFTLLKLWESRERNRVTRATYDRIGGGRLALARSADNFYDKLIPQEQVTARRILLRMVRPGDGLEVTSSRIRRHDLYRGGEDPSRIERVLRKLVAVRLVRLTAGETPDDDQIEVAHEAVVRNWPMLVDWLEDEKAAITMRRRLESRAAEWIRLGQGSGGLLDEVELREAERWLTSAEAAYLGYDPALPMLVQASRAALERAEQEKEAARERERDLALAQVLAVEQAAGARQLRRVVIALVVLLVLALMAAGYAFNQRSIAQTAQAQVQAQLIVAQSQRLAFAAQSQLRDAPETALLLAYEAISLNHSPVSEQALRDAVEQVPLWPTPLNGHAGSVVKAVFSPDGQLVLTAAADGTARLWNLTGRLLASFKGHTAGVESAVFSPDGRQVLTASDDRTARLWDLTGKLLVSFKGHTRAVRSAVFSPDGQRILTASDDGTARLWNLKGQMLTTFAGHTAPVRSAAFSPDGQYIVTASDDAKARLWDLTGRPTATFADHSLGVHSALFSPDGRYILTASEDAIVRLWDRSGQLITRFSGHTAGVVSAVFSPNGRQVLTASGDNTARLWDLAGKPLASFKGHVRVVRSAIFSPDGQRVLTASEDGTARLWNLQGELVATLSGHTREVWSAMFSPDGRRVLTASGDGTARLWDAVDRPLGTLRGHTDRIRSAVFSPDGKHVLTASSDDTARLWDLTGNMLTIFKGHTATVQSAVFSPDGQQVLTGSWDKTARVWDLTGRQITELDHPAVVRSAVFSPDGKRILTGADDGLARLWDLSGQLLVIFKGHMDKVLNVAFSPDGQHILTASADNTARLWDLTGHSLVDFKGHTSVLWSAVFSPDGQRVLTASNDGTARLWSPDGTPLATLRGHAASVGSAVFSPNGQRILTAAGDSTARLWDMDGNTLTIFTGHTRGVYSAVFSPDGKRVLTAAGDGTARQYLVNVSDLLIVAACRVGRGLTDEEIARFQVPTPLRFDFAKRQCPPVLGMQQ